MGRRPEQQAQQGSQQGGQGEGRPQAERRTERRPPRERRSDKPAEDKPAEGAEFSVDKWDFLLIGLTETYICYYRWDYTSIPEVSYKLTNFSTWLTTWAVVRT